MGFPQHVKDQALFSSGRHCCICHKFCGIKIECHHIILVSEKGENTLDNCIPLCFDCHSDQKSYDSKHPKGTKYSRAELKMHRENWYDKVKNNLGAGTQDHLEQDKSTISIILSVLKPTGTIKTLRFANFGWLQESSMYTDVYSFEDLMQSEPWHEFFDADLEALRFNLIQSINKFTLLKAHKTILNPEQNYFSVPSEWAEQKPDEYQEIINEFHDLIDSIIGNYDNLIRLSRSKLGIII